MSSNVIDFVARRNQREQKVSSQPENHQGSQVIDISEMRAAEIAQDRRVVKRTILTEFVSTYVVLPDIGLQKMALYDISRTGLSFDLGFESGQFKVGESVAIRLYLNKNTYFPFVVTVENVREISHDSVYRHGTSIQEGAVNQEALEHFLGFIECVSTTVKKDDGDVVVNKLNT